MHEQASQLRWLILCGTLLLLASCGSHAAAPAARPVAEHAAPPPAAPAPPPAPKELSAYERRWQTACTEPTAAGRCPAPFDRPGVFFNPKGKGDYAPPNLCDVGVRTPDPATAAALESKRKPLRACFRGAAKGAWVDVVSDGSRPPEAAPGVPPHSIECVAKLVKRALPNTGPASVKRVVVLDAGDSKESEPTLSKESVAAMINAHAEEVSTCYDGALEIWPGLKGRFAPRVVVWFDGSVALVRTQDNSLDNPALECCINSAVRNWRFGPPEDGNIVIVTLPFLLGPVDPK